ncbi:MAG: hypothetical protein VB034_04290 [Eubacteriales bacterium]|nr:hypothetical protein [Eubacteriales bacterium]
MRSDEKVYGKLPAELLDEDWEKRADAIRGDTEEAILSLLMRTDEDWRVRAAVICKHWGNDELVKRAAFADADWRVRLLAVRALCRDWEGFAETIEAVAKKDVEPKVRAVAAGVLTNPSVTLEILYGDSDERVRQAAATALLWKSSYRFTIEDSWIAFNTPNEKEALCIVPRYEDEYDSGSVSCAWDKLKESIRLAETGTQFLTIEDQFTWGTSHNIWKIEIKPQKDGKVELNVVCSREHTHFRLPYRSLCEAVDNARIENPVCLDDELWREYREMLADAEEEEWERS